MYCKGSKRLVTGKQFHYKLVFIWKKILHIHSIVNPQHKCLPLMTHPTSWMSTAYFTPDTWGEKLRGSHKPVHVPTWWISLCIQMEPVATSQAPCFKMVTASELIRQGRAMILCKDWTSACSLHEVVPTSLFCTHASIPWKSELQAVRQDAMQWTARRRSQRLCWLYGK